MDDLLSGDGGWLDAHIKTLCDALLARMLNIATGPDAHAQRKIFEYECGRIAYFAQFKKGAEHIAEDSAYGAELGAVYRAIGRLVASSDLWQAVVPPPPAMRPSLSVRASAPSSAQALVGRSV